MIDDDGISPESHVFSSFDHQMLIQLKTIGSLRVERVPHIFRLNACCGVFSEI